MASRAGLTELARLAGPASCRLHVLICPALEYFAGSTSTERAHCETYCQAPEDCAKNMSKPAKTLRKISQGLQKLCEKYFRARENFTENNSGPAKTLRHISLRGRENSRENLRENFAKSISGGAKTLRKITKFSRAQTYFSQSFPYLIK